MKTIGHFARTVSIPPAGGVHFGAQYEGGSLRLLAVRDTGKESVSVYVCPSCGETLTPVEGSLMPRPCPHCLDSTGRVVEMVPDQPTLPDPRLAEES